MAQQYPNSAGVVPSAAAPQQDNATKATTNAGVDPLDAAGTVKDNAADTASHTPRNTDSAGTANDALSPSSKTPAQSNAALGSQMPAQQDATSGEAKPGAGNTDANAVRPCQLGAADEGPEMVVIAGDTFTMGSPEREEGRQDDEGPQHNVTIVQPFAIGRCEVTVGEFRRFVKEAQYQTTAEKTGGCYVWNLEKKESEQRAAAKWDAPGFNQDDTYPVTCVSYDDALAYIDWLNQRSGQTYRLPTESEWEYAARAGTWRARYWGDDPDLACDYANVADNSARQIGSSNWTYHNCNDGFANTAPVAGNRRPNNFGLYDVIGNVWEWTEDCWHGNYEGAPVDGTSWAEANNGDCSRRMVRGGSWYSVPVGARSAFRDYYTTGGANFMLGFRLARTLK